MLVVSNTTPLNYLILIERIDVLRALYGEVVISQAVHDELQKVATPQPVRVWIANKPDWLKVERIAVPFDPALARLHIGERQAIALAEHLQSDALIIDDLDGRKEAVKRGVRVIGTLRVLYDAAGLGLCDLQEAYDRLKQTSFRLPAKVMEHFLALDSARKKQN